MQTLFAASVALCLVLSLGHAASLVKPDLHPEHCSWGAQYWCSSAQTADLCGKAEWCALHDWPYDVVQDLPCTVIQQIIKNTRSLVRNAAKKPESEYDYAMFLARSCTFFKDEKERQQCKELVTSEDVLPKLVKLVDSKLSMKSVALAVGVCQKNIPKDKPCLRCPEAVSSVQKLVSKFLTQDKYMKLIDTQCVKLGQGHLLCQAMGQAQFQDFLNGLINAPTASVCKGVTQCLGVLPSLQSVQASTECETCKFVVKEIRELDRSQGVQTILQNLMKSACGQLGNFAQLCDILADEGLQYLSELIATEMEPDVICEELKLCGQPEKQAVQASSPVGATIACDICELIVKEIDKAIGSNYTEEELKKFLNDFCDRLPTPLRGQCTDFVTQYSDQIIKVLLNEVDPKLICTTLGLCKNETNVLQFTPKVDVPGQPSNNSCLLCKYVVTFMVTFLKKNSSVAEVTYLLDTVCDLLPQNLSQECETLVDEYGPLIVQLLVAELQPEKVCEAMKLCAANKPAFSQVHTQPKQPNDELCDVCKYVVNYLDTFLDENSTQAEIEAELDKVCKILPANWTQQCVSLVESYTPLIIQMLIGELRPEDVCKAIKWCPANKQGFILRQAAEKPLSGVSCAVCEFAMQKLDIYLADKKTEAEIQAALGKVCDLLPVTIKSECDQLLQEYGQLITELLVHQLDPKKICTYLGQCKAHPQLAAPILKMAAPVTKVGKQKTELCALCESVTLYLENILKQNPTQVEIAAALGRVCDLLPEAQKKPCVQLLPMITGFVIDLIELELPPKLVCKLIKVCVDDEVTVPKSQKPSSSLRKGELCPLCLMVCEGVYGILEKNNTKEAIVSALDKVCDVLPSTIKDECLSFVSLYLPYVVDLIVQEIPPHQICQELGLCNATMGQVKLTHSLQVNRESAVKAGELCTLCIYVFEALDKLLPQNRTQAKIEKALEEVCNYLSTFEDQCKHFVALYTPFVIDMITQKFTPPQICNALGLCTNATSIFTSAKLHIPTNLRKLSAGPQCALCEYVITILDDQLSQNATKEEIKEALEKVCNFMPKTLEADCKDFIANYTDILLNLLETLPPDQICAYLKLCSSQVKGKLHIATNLRSLSSGPECALCEYVMKYLASLLAQNATEQQIEAALDQVCNLLPSSLKSQCDAFVSGYTPQLLLLLKTLLPSQVCSYLKLCPSQVTVKLHDAPINTRKLPTGPECALCEYVIKYLDNILKDNATEQEIVAALEEVCNFVPPSLKSSCVAFITQYTPQLLELLENFPPDQVCSQLGLCSSQVKGKLHIPVDLKTYSGGLQCDLCDFVVKYLDSTLTKNATEQQIEAALDRVCSLVPSYLKSECTTLIADYTPTILELLKTLVSPDEVCSKLGLCSSQVKALKPPSAPLLFASEDTTTAAPTTTAPTTTPVYMQYCSACKFVLFDFQTAIINSNFWQNKTRDSLEVVCTLLQTGQDVCQRLVDLNFQYVINTVKDFNFPEVFCQKIDLCEPPGQIETESRCSSCQTVVRVLKSQSHQVTSPEKINALADSTCNLASSHAASQCKTILKERMPQIRKIMASNDDPASVCQAASLCMNASGDMLYKLLRPLGGL
ncbi:hypothetical protein BsWGS_20780 [Bradybaena similaris]